MELRCPECGSENIMCIENGVDVVSDKYQRSIRGDLFICGDCDERFVTGLGTDSKEWGVPRRWR